MIVIEQITENIYDLDISDLASESVLLKHDELTKIHRKLKTTAGKEFAISLPIGSILKDGDVLYRDHEQVVFISLEEEKIIAVKPQSNLQWAKTAYNVGNMHQAAYLKEEGIYIPFDEAMLRIIKKLGVEYKVCMGQLNGERANVQSSEHLHSHAEAHHHHHHHEK